MQVDGGAVADQEAKEKCIWNHFNELLGTYKHRTTSLKFFGLSFRNTDLRALDDDFFEDELKKAIFDLHLEKAPGPDGFIGTFYRNAGT